MSNRLIIVGAGGHGKVVADNGVKNGYTDIYFVDDCICGKCMGFPIIGRTSEIETMDDGKTDFVLGIGNNDVRKMLAEKYPVNWVKLIHPSAQIAVGVDIGIGTVIMAQAVVNAGAVIGRHCILNTCSVVEHDNVIGDYVHISPRAALGGTVHIGDSTHIGIGANIINNVSVCKDVIVGAGAVVVNDILEQGTYAGVPVRKIR